MAQARGLAALAVLLAIVVALVSPGAASAEPGPDDVIILFRTGTTPGQRDGVIRFAAGLVKQHFRLAGATAARVGPLGRRFLARHPAVAAVIPDREVETLGRLTDLVSGTSPQVVPAGVARIGARGTGFNGTGIGVAIVDTGIDFRHADLAVAGACFTAYTSCQDDEGHGSHVAGIVGAKDNTIDVVGVAPAVTLYAVKVLNRRGRGTDSTIMAGLDWIATNATRVSPAIRVVNMSLGRAGTLGDNPALHASVQALHAAGIVVVVAAGNDPAVEVSGQVPATYPEVVAVASTTATTGKSSCAGHPAPVARDTASYFTTDGAYDAGIGVTISAPGEDREDITKSCVLRSTGILSTRLGGGTVRYSGTSMAAPHVAGVAALLMEQSGATAPEDVRRRLRLGADGLDAAPADSPSTAYTFDDEREGIVYVPGALAQP